MATNESNSQNDRNRDDLNRQDNLKGEAGKNPSAGSQNSDWNEKSQHDQTGMEGKGAARTTNPSATQGFEANRERNKSEDKGQNSQSRDGSESTNRNNGL